VRFVRLFFSLTALLGALLLFLVEPMFARMVLPLLGGAPAVWNTCLVFYQCALLIGYLYAHGIGRQPPRLQVVAHVVVLLVAVIALPIAVRGGATPPASANPVGWVLQILVISLGLPFVALSATGPLLQRWFTLVGDPSTGSPYSLFAASNAGSFLALLGYPLLVEPMLRVRVQSAAWAVGYGLFACLMAGCGVLVWRLARQPNRAPAASAAPTALPPASARRTPKSPSADVVADDDPLSARLRWLGLAAIPSTLMMSVTTFIATDIASVPLLWMLPLAIYLLTFVLAFAERQFISRAVILGLFPLLVVLVVALVLAPPVFPIPMIALHLTAFFVLALACHMELAASRPPAESLTEFYLWLSAGGALGGLFNALVAPLIFLTPFEYPLAALSTCLMLPKRSEAHAAARSQFRRVIGLAATALPVALVVASLWVVQRFNASVPDDTFTRYAVIFGPACFSAFFLRGAPLRMGIALGAVVVAGAFVRFDNRVPIHLERSFFGIHRVVFSGRERVLLSGTTNHGAQSIDPALRCEPLTYYSREGPVGQLFEALKSRGAPRSVGVVGLGTASMAAYATAGQAWTFFEINPAVERLARDPDYFTYLKDCAPGARVVIGDARLRLADESDSAMDVIVLDAFSSDSIPVHLMTLEAFELYLRKLAPNGVLAIHVSNRYLELTPVVAATARQAGLTSIVQLHAPGPSELRTSGEISTSRWVLAARASKDFGSLARDPRWDSLEETSGPVWTDDYSNVFKVMRW
jgi:hypothetical protein